MSARDLFKESCAIFCEGTLPWATAPLNCALAFVYWYTVVAFQLNDVIALTGTKEDDREYAD